MRVGLQVLQLCFRPLQLTPDLRPGEEEPLLRREAVDLRARPVAERLQQREGGDGEPAEVGDVLASYVCRADSGRLMSVRCLRANPA
jgi:hypothetical protein